MYLLSVNMERHFDVPVHHVS